jgi:hypothetical protein
MNPTPEQKITMSLERALLQLANARGYVMPPEVRAFIQEAQAEVAEAKTSLSTLSSRSRLARLESEGL